MASDKIDAVQHGISGANVPEKKSLVRDIHWTTRRKFKVLRNKINTLLWPGSVLNLGCLVGGVTAVRVSSVSLLQPIKIPLQNLESYLPLSEGILSSACVCTVSGLALFIALTLWRRLMLRLLLAHREWMYEPPGKPSVGTKVWGAAIRLLRGWSVTLYSSQSSLPRQPVPRLEDTIDKLMTSLEPVYSEQPEELEKLRKESKEFQLTIGRKLQRALVLRSWWAPHYVSDWWEKYIYLMGRSSLAINSNYYIMDQSYWTPTDRLCARAAGVVYQLLRARDMILTEELDPLAINNTIPVCMEQYRRIFSTTRVPGEEIDTLVNYPPSKSQHVVVNRRGLLYKLEVTDPLGRLASPCYLEQQFENIVADADSKYSSIPEVERMVPVLTSMDRTAWAKTRKEFFCRGVNRETLHWVESSILYVVLDTNSFPDLSSRAAHLLHGTPGLFWFDKSLQVIAMNDGHFGMNCEHSYADAPAVGHVVEFNMTYDVTAQLYASDGHCIPFDPARFAPAPLSKPLLLQWEVPDRLATLITNACAQFRQEINDIDLVLYDHTDFGKGSIKKCKISPDAFIQMALNATYRKLTGRHVLTYEAAMTRLYRNGRTETVRSLTKEANTFVDALLDTSRSVDEKRELLTRACNNHVVMYKDAMNGKGIDRHLFALYVISKGLGMESEFLKKALSIPWTLSTSQQPQQQIPWSPKCEDPKYNHQLSPGGGFGPVAADGYGVSYMVPGDLRIFFHITSRKSTGKTSSLLFQQTLQETMTEMKMLFPVFFK
ncbi:carnitine O-palmitoyltransferase 1, liver isoform-like [Physella acuta]|uniref:carnitine O-palmitoyltransferase 1, liver isoform-like n=1 Tax=Physella acuta TaxID=109671 RepID=UPI0027DC27DC|nr:carnitine O-palmitoyltransferase 1, liver isoform-like [Physella acuta]